MYPCTSQDRSRSLLEKLRLRLAVAIGPRYDSVDRNRLFGHWRVVYDDGKVSQPFCACVAVEYASIFGGRVEPIPERERRRL